ncbi:MAG: carbon monoxide dehydrogenase subunit G [Methanomassiliicoccales archaeon]
MKLEGTFDVSAPPERVFAFLTDATRLASILPDVEQLEQDGEDSYKVRLRIGVSYIKGRFNVKLRIAQKTPSSRIVIEGNGTGSGSSATFTALCDISGMEAGSKVNWSMDLQIGGLAAAVGSRMMSESVRKYIDNLVNAFRGAVSVE